MAWEDELQSASLPAALTPLWNIYQRLRRRAGGSGFGPNPVSWPAIEAFQRVIHRSLAPWEIELIEMIDDLFLAEAARSAKAMSPKTEKAE